MALVSLDGGYVVPIGPGWNAVQTLPAALTSVLDAANEALIFIGHIVTADGGSHTLDTTGSSSLGWRTGAVTFANGSTVVKVGLAPVDTANGPAARASNAANVISFDVSANFTGGGGGITATAWQTSVPTTGTKTVANGDFIAFAVQMTAVAGGDVVNATYSSSSTNYQRPTVTGYLGGLYGTISGGPVALITFSDGTLGWFYASDVLSTISTRTWNTTGGVDEYGQLYQLPFPCKIYGLYGWIDPDNDSSVALYSDPLGTPVAERTVTLDLNTVAQSAGRRFSVLFPSPYTVGPDQVIAAVFKPGAASISAYYKTLASATHRVTDVWGTSGYGVQSAGGGAAFTDSNSSLDHYYIGLLVGAFEHGVNPTYVAGLGL
jgi:hypothetical protein